MTGGEIIIEMPYEPLVSVNRAYGQRRNGRKYLKPEAEGWKLVLRTRTMRGIVRAGWPLPLPPGAGLIINLDARFPHQPGRKPDGDNFLKLAQDAIAAGFGVDDHICLSRVRSVEHGCRDAGSLIYAIRLA